RAAGSFSPRWRARRRTSPPAWPAPRSRVRSASTRSPATPARPSARRESAAGLCERPAVGEVGVEKLRVDIEVVVNRVVDPAVVLAAVADVQRRYAKVLQKRREVGARSERADAPVRPAADFVLVLRLRFIDDLRLPALPDGQTGFGILDVSRDIVDEPFEHV